MKTSEEKKWFKHIMNSISTWFKSVNWGIVGINIGCSILVIACILCFWLLLRWAQQDHAKKQVKEKTEQNERICKCGCGEKDCNCVQGKIKEQREKQIKERKEKHEKRIQERKRKKEQKRQEIIQKRKKELEERKKRRDQKEKELQEKRERKTKEIQEKIKRNILYNEQGDI